MPLLLRQIYAVFMSYLTRRAFQVMLLGMAAGLVIGELMSMAHYGGMHIASQLFGMLVLFMIAASAFAAVLLFFLQAREQLMGLRARLIPESRTAHLIVIGILFVGISIAISSIEWESPRIVYDSTGRSEWQPGVSPVGQTVVVLAYVTMAAFAVYNPWLLPILATMLILAVRRSPVEELIGQATISWPSTKPGPIDWQIVQRLMDRNAMYLRAVIFLSNLIALQILVRLARPKPARSGFFMSAIHRMLRPVSNFQSSRVVPAIPHAPVTSMFSRGRHRRYAVHSHKAAWVLAGGLTVMLVGLLWLVGLNAPANSRVCAALVMLTLVPGAVVAAGWRERWPGLGYESLFPSAREQFVREIAVGLAADLAEFWVAALISSIAVVAVFAPESLLTPSFMVSIIASLMMQVLWCGTIFLTSRIRQTIPYVVILIGIALAMFMPIFQVWEDRKVFGLGVLMLIALAQMTCGVIFLLSGLGLWRKADLA